MGMISPQSRLDKVTENKPDFVPGSSLSVVAALASPPSDMNQTMTRSGSYPGGPGPERAPSHVNSVSSSEEGDIAEPLPSLATSQPIEIVPQATSDITPIGTPLSDESTGSAGSDGQSSSVLAKYIQKFQEEDPQGVWKSIGRTRSSPGPGIRRHL